MNLKYGIASPSTITRMLNGIDEELALYAFMEWIGEIVESRNTHLAIVGTQTAIMEQIHEQGGHFVLTVKKNQPEAYEEIHTFMDKLGAEDLKRKKAKLWILG